MATRHYGLLAVVGLSTPFALVVETGVRKAIMPAEFDQVRAWLSPDVTPWAWAMVPVAVVATGLGFVLQRWLVARATGRPPRAGQSPADALARAEFDALMLSTSAPQIPALLGTIAFMVGANLTPVLVTMGVATLGVLSLGLGIGRTRPPTICRRPGVQASSSAMDDAQIREILENTRTIAVLGLHDDPAKPAFYVPDYLARQGYRIRGVNPKLAGEQRFGQTVVASLPEIDEAVDLVDVFRASASLPMHLPEILAMEPRPNVVWLQLGIADDQFVTQLRDAGLTVVKGRCALAEHRRLGIAAR